MLGQDIVGNAHNVCGNPAPRAPISREPSMDDDEVPLRHDDAGLVFERRRCALDEIRMQEHGNVTIPLMVCGNKARVYRVSFGDQGTKARITPTEKETS